MYNKIITISIFSILIFFMSNTLNHHVKADWSDGIEEVLDKIIAEETSITLLNEEQKKQVNFIMEEVQTLWTDSYGFMKLNPNENNTADIDNENPVLFTAEYFFLLKRLGMLEGEVKEDYKNKVAGMINLLRLEPGLFNTYPDKTGFLYRTHFSRDEQIGLITLDYAFDWELGFAKELYEYGEANKLTLLDITGYYYENRTWSAPGEDVHSDTPEFSEMDGFRQSDFIEFVRICAGRKPTETGLDYFSSELLNVMTEPHYETSNKILASLMIHDMHSALGIKPESKLNFISKSAIVALLDKMKKEYGENYFLGLLNIYFDNQEHPLRRLAEFL